MASWASGRQESCWPSWNMHRGLPGDGRKGQHTCTGSQCMDRVIAACSGGALATSTMHDMLRSMLRHAAEHGVHGSLVKRGEG